MQKQCIIERKIQLVPLPLFLLRRVSETRYFASQLTVKHPVYFMEYTADAAYIPITLLTIMV